MINELRNSCSGGCHCGAVRYQVSGPVSNLCYCHCRSCRMATGAVMVAWGTFASASLVVTRGVLRERETSPGVTRGRCADCGTALTYRHEKRPGQIDVTLATLDQPNPLRPEAHIWVQDKLPWVGIDDGLPRYETVWSAS